MAVNPEVEEQSQSNNITNVSVPDDLVKPKNFGGFNEEYGDGESEEDRRAQQLKLSRSRISLDGVEAFANNPNATWLVNMGRGPGHRIIPEATPEQIEGKIANGDGTRGIFTVVEPADLDVYRSLLPAPLKMPKHPVVGATLLDMNTHGRVNRFLEGRLSIKALCPDGLESWLVISTPVPYNLQCREGVVWGWPKYVADHISLDREKDSARAEVVYQSEVRYSLDFTAGPVADEKALKAFGRVEGGNTVSWHWIQGGAVLMRQGRGPGFDTGPGPRIVDWQAGQVKVHIKQTDKWAGLIPEDSVSDGCYQRFIGGGQGDSVWTKLATVGGMPRHNGQSVPIRIPKF
ncbi:MAG: hypothetical protein CMQ33_10200 [Gammaproteobacteria bacterium]|nr:hypothetical protein [Gammaproteobacteria bacterium]